jgi:hypothetical protein
MGLNLKNKVIVHPHPNPPLSRGRELIRSADKYSPSTGGRGLGGGGAELLQNKKLAFVVFLYRLYINLLLFEHLYSIYRCYCS